MDVPTIAVPFDLSQGQDIAFYRRVEKAADQGPPNLYFDCSALKMVHSSHIGLLWKAREVCRQKSTEVTLQNTSISLIRTLQVLDLTGVFEFSDTCEYETVLPTVRQLPIVAAEPHAGDFEADAAGVDRALYEFIELMGQWQLSEDVKFDMRTLFYEAATNIRCHSGLSPDSKIQYRATCTGGELQLVFEDSGKPFNPVLLPDNYSPETAAKHRQIRGFGISLIRRLATDVEYTRRDDTINVLSLTKRYGDGR
jgi:anti-sigma regulatory factor (Ser/Thr protein kinase)/anti-anti-sigma regulatory factor